MFNLEQSIAKWRQQMLAAGIKSPMPLEELESHLREEIQRQLESGMDPQQAFEMSVSVVGQTGALRCEFKKVEGAATKRVGIVAAFFGMMMIVWVFIRHHEMGPPWRGDQLGWILFSLIVIFFGLGAAFFNFNLGNDREVRLWKLAGISYSLFALWVSMMLIFRFLIMPQMNVRFTTLDRTLSFIALAIIVMAVLGWRWLAKILPVIHSRRIRTIVGIVCCLLGPVSMALFILFIAPQLRGFPAMFVYVLWIWMWTIIAMLGSVGYGLAEAAHRQTEAIDS
jgi:hypothetical protein